MKGRLWKEKGKKHRDVETPHHKSQKQTLLSLQNGFPAERNPGSLPDLCWLDYSEHSDLPEGMSGARGIFYS